MKLCVRRPARQMILCWRAVLPLDLKIMTRQLTLCALPGILHDGVELGTITLALSQAKWQMAI